MTCQPVTLNVFIAFAAGMILGHALHGSGRYVSAMVDGFLTGVGRGYREARAR